MTINDNTFEVQGELTNGYCNVSINGAKHTAHVSHVDNAITVMNQALQTKFECVDKHFITLGNTSINTYIFTVSGR